LVKLLTKREQEYFDNKQFYCHLRARQWDIPKSLAMIRETLRWRREAKPYSVSCDSIEHHLKSGKNYHLGRTKNHRPTVIMRVRLDVPGDNPGKIHTILYQMERSLRLIKTYGKKYGPFPDPVSLLDTPPHEQVSWIFDCKNFAKKDMDWPLTKELARVLDHYPEKLGVVFAVDTPVIFRAFWKVARTFLDEKTVHKVQFVSGMEQRKKVFPNYFDLDMLEQAFAGNNPFRYNHEAYYEMLRKEEKEGITILEQPAGLDDKNTKKVEEVEVVEGNGGEEEIDYTIGDFEAEEREKDEQNHDSSSSDVSDKESKESKKAKKSK